MKKIASVFGNYPVIRKSVLGIVLLLLMACLFLMFWWGNEPASFDVVERATKHNGGEQTFVTGFVTVATVIEVANILLEKRGGYLSNDVMPPGVFMDNIPSWEFGVITQIRDMARALRNDFGRSQTQSAEDPDLMIADPLFHFDSGHWVLPATESEYRKGIETLQMYLMRLSNQRQPRAQFYARADNLRDWLAIVEKRLGSLSQSLTASVGQLRVNTDIQDEAETSGAPADEARDISVKTPWLEIDDVFYEARGACWVLSHFFRAIDVDLREVLRKKNALVGFRQVIRELEATQDRLWSPMILNGTGFGYFANHSLVMASYISRANAAVIDLRNLLEQG